MENKSGNVQSLERALILIDVLAENSDGVSIKTLAEATSLNKSTIYRLLQTLVNFGYAYQDSQNDKYHLGIKILSLSNSLLENIDFREVARPFLKDLVKETGNIAQLSTEFDGRIVYIDKVENPKKFIRTISQIGKGLPLHCSASGKVILAWKDPVEINDLLGKGPYKNYTKNTITDYESLMEQLKQVREQGFATDWFEHQENIYCIASPIRDVTGEVIAAICMTGTSLDINPRDIKEYTNQVIKTAKLISNRLGYNI